MVHIATEERKSTEASEEPYVKTRVDGNIYHVILNRPAKRNSIPPAMVLDIEKAFIAADDHPEVRAIIVSAEGPVFSAGIDLMSLGRDRSPNGQDPGRGLRRTSAILQRAFDCIEGTELPVIGAIQGHAIGLGLEFALSFDFRIATESCKFKLPETRLGLVPDVGGSTRLPRLVGTSRAKDMIMTSRSVPADEALMWGLVNRVVPDDQLMQAAEAFAQEIAKNAPLAVGMSKLVIDQGDGHDKVTQLALERWAQSQLITTEDLKEAVQSFVQKRDADFKGK